MRNHNKLTSVFYPPPPPACENLIFEFTKEKDLLAQYYQIREQEFKLVYGVNYYNGEETDFDRKGEILIARKENQCVGGLRLFVPQNSTEKLPLEINNFCLKEYFPELKKEIVYGQTSFLTLLPEFRGGFVTNKLFYHLREKVINLKIDIIFSIAPISNARLYRQHALKMGFKNIKIHRNIDLPDYPMYEDIKHYLISLKIKSF